MLVRAVDALHQGIVLGTCSFLWPPTMSKVRCPDCHKGFYNPDVYDRCYTCNMQADGKRLCGECHEQYYDPELYQCCYSCHKEKAAEEDDGWEKEYSESDVSSVFPHR